MEDQKHLPMNEAPINKPRRKKTKLKDPEMFQSPGDSVEVSHNLPTFSSQKGQKASKRGLVNNVSLISPERLNSDSLPDSSTSGNEYRALRRKYLLLEEESFGLGRELKAVEDDIKTLEDEKLSLLDELVVLEGLIDPSDLQPRGPRLQ